MIVPDQPSRRALIAKNAGGFGGRQPKESENALAARQAPEAHRYVAGHKRLRLSMLNEASPMAISVRYCGS